ncbi:MAG TPA: class I SAM-dependent methyltransferase, partial [Verrucomicrobiales bacterium]|nr:class I SAM-dependent methyltransferase [Verrucomicrobiales bacterium]
TPALEEAFRPAKNGTGSLPRRGAGGSAFPGGFSKMGTDSLQILDLACGSCREMESISSALKKVTADSSRSVRFVGADIRAAEIDEARERARILAAPDFKAEFLLEDCSKLQQHQELGGGFDMVFLRHQNYWNDPVIWRGIFSRGLERLHDDGVLVITSYFDREHALALKAITKIGGHLVTSIRNPDSRQLSTPGKSVDRHLAVFRRRAKPVEDLRILL